MVSSTRDADTQESTTFLEIVGIITLNKTVGLLGAVEDDDSIEFLALAFVQCHNVASIHADESVGKSVLGNRALEKR